MLQNNKQSFSEKVFFKAKDISKQALDDLQTYYENLEIEFDKTISRTRWYVNGWRTRLLSTPIGDLKITRRIYKNISSGKTRILFDAFIGLELRKTFIKEFDGFVLEKITSVKSYSALRDVIGIQISNSTISRIVSRAKVSCQLLKLLLLIQCS